MEPSVIASAAVSSLVKEGIRSATQALKACFHSPRSTWLWKEAALSSHLEWVASWSAGIQIGDMAHSEAVEARTIHIGFAEASARFHVAQGEPVLHERDLLADRNAYVILGDPGGGKTTAIKRICRMLLVEGPHDATDPWQYPIVVPLRNLPKGWGLIAHIGQVLGLSFEIPKLVPVRQIGRSVTCEDESLLAAVVRSVTASGALLLIDGIDELDPDERNDVESEIQDLIHLLPNGKLIMTARSGSLTRAFEAVRRVQLLPLDLGQQRQVANLWLGEDGIRFFDELNRTPYADLAERPLFLVRLLLIFRRDRSLPPQPCDVYERFIRLLLEDWDRERDINRQSRYANFGPDQKLRFLAALSHYLLIEAHRVAFHRRELERAYVVVCEKFHLPELQAEQVAQEIVSHTGVIVQAGFDRYEFSHLSLQEYLCAHHLLRDPLKSMLHRYLATYPAPLAIAATMSSNPSAFMALLILSDRREEEGGAAWEVFLRRLAYERPKLSAGTELGMSALKLISDRPDLEDLVFDAVKVNNNESLLIKSLASALSAYEAGELSTDSAIRLSRVADLRLTDPLKQPAMLELPYSLVVRLVAVWHVVVSARDPSGMAGELTVEDEQLRVRGTRWDNWRPPR
jgi:hypothetical protein